MIAILITARGIDTQTQTRFPGTRKGISAVAGNRPGVDVGAGHMAHLLHQIPAPVEFIPCAEQSRAEGVAIVLSGKTVELALLCFQAKGVQIGFQHAGQGQGAIEPVELLLMITWVVERAVVSANHGSGGERIQLVTILCNPAQARTIKHLPYIGDFAIGHQYLITVSHLLPTDPRCQCAALVMKIAVDKGLLYFVTALIGRAGQVLTPCPSIL
ncbi:hypothetical protein D3C84_213960 [compost metagenome]